MGSTSLVGTEVPILGTNFINLVKVSVPDTCAAARGSPAVAPLTEDAASCVVIGTPPTYLIWRIRKNYPLFLEIFELSADKESLIAGLCIIFPEPLSPFAYICKNEINAASCNPYLLYTLSVSGVAYLLQLKNISTYASFTGFSPSEIIWFELQNSPDYGPITAISAKAGCLVIGRDDGSIACFRMGLLDLDAPGFMHELRDDAILGRLWGFMSRGRTAGLVKDVAISDIHGTKVIFVLHVDGTLRAWDLLSRAKIFSHSVTIPGTTIARMWVGEVNHNPNAICLAILHKQILEVDADGIYIHILNVTLGDRITLSVDSSVQCISLSEGELIDVKLTPNKIWVLKEGELLVQDLLCPNGNLEHQCYTLQEAFIADQLFQSSTLSLDDLFRITCSIFSSAKAQVIAFVSSIFLHRLLHPGVHNSIVLREVLEVYNKHWTDAEFQAFTVVDLKREISLLIEHEAVSGNAFSVFKCWRDLCTRYFECWCKKNAPYALFIDSMSGAVGLIRENSVSLFRCLEDIELLVQGTSHELDDFMKSGLNTSGDDLENEILFEVLHCNKYLRQQFGSVVAPIFHQLVVSFPTISTDSVVVDLLKTLESGCDSSSAELDVSELGVNFALQRKNTEHKSLRRFSVDMLAYLHALIRQS
ncbi:hypothetical protein Nepgr_025703 [Nepenthes gracilis]|uniref:Uncharacterized protein n=1 Tax=Nepenthes gracilis TaxID=150966 RepID=A0AAD3T6I4_NEPGR|nr:hypothetical protein Nepgr_025703 [Nepenthes gracilis]